MKVKCFDYHGKAHLTNEADLIDRNSAYGAYIRDNQILLIRDPRSLHWELPGGGINKGESPEEGLKREIKEETGVSVVGEVKFLTKWNEYYFDLATNEAWRSLRKFYVFSDISGDFLTRGNGDDSDFAGMVNMSELNNLSMAENMRDVIQLAQNSQGN